MALITHRFVAAIKRITVAFSLLLLGACSLQPEQKAAEPSGQLFFMYSCIHCNTFYHEQLTPFRQQQPDLRIEEVPIAWFPYQQPAVRAFYAAELAGINPAFHNASYQAHRADRLLRPDAAYFADLAASCCDLPKARFLELYNSAAVDARFQNAQGLKELLQIRSVPVVMQQGQRTELEKLVP